MFKIAFIGAGSLGFTREILSDIMAVEKLRDIEIAFTDIDRHNLEMVTQICQRDIDANGLPVKIQATLDRREAFKDAKYIVNSVRVGGLEAFETDIDIPLKYGVDQCVGDTLCAGGIMYGQRGIAAVLDFCKDIKAVAREDVLMLNYANPNAMITWACNAYGGVRTIGLCHGVQYGHEQIAQALKLKKKDLDIQCAGINHQTWYISVKYKGRDMLPYLLDGFENDEDLMRTEKCRIDVLRRTGYYTTESNGHFSEYVPWYRKRPNELLQWIDEGSWINGETGGYLRVCREGRNWFEYDFPNLLREEPCNYSAYQRGEEHASYVIEALETGKLYRGHLNVVNHGAITNLPEDAIVEVPCYVDYNGINVPSVGDLPWVCAAICSQSIHVQRLSVLAAVSGDDRLLRQAMMMDPLVGAVCSTPEIWQMTDEMLVAGEAWLPQYKQAVLSAKERLSKGRLIPTRDGYAGAARNHTKTIEEMKANVSEARKNATKADKGKDRAKRK